MPRLTLALGRPTLADEHFERRLLTDLALMGAGAALVALATQLTIPLWPVPMTAQTLAVLVVGAGLGAARGALAIVVYVAIGVLGLPVFSGGASGLDTLAGGTGGFILGFIATAAVAGWLAQRRWDRRLPTGLAALGIAAVVPYLFGLPWLAAWLGSVGLPNDVPSVVAAGLAPFVVGDLVKVVVAAVILWLAWRVASRTRSRAQVEADAAMGSE